MKLHITVDQLVECLGKKALRTMRTIRSLDGGFAHQEELGRRLDGGIGKFCIFIAQKKGRL